MKTQTASLMMLTAVMTALSTAAGAQQVTLGVRGGLNRSETSLPLAAVVERSPSAGFHAGATFGIRPSERWEIQAQALYTQKGFRGERADADLSYEVEASYLEIPFLVKRRFPGALGGRAVPHVFAGPSIGVELSCDLQGKDGPARIFHLCDGPPVNFDHRKKVDAGFMVGAGIEVGAGPGAFQLDVTYDRGVRDLGAGGPFPTAVRNASAMASMGYSFIW